MTFAARLAAPLLLLTLTSGSLHLAAQNDASAQDHFEDTTGVATFPFEWTQGVIFVPVSLRGSAPLRFVLDSGSQRILIDRSVATSLGFQPGEAGSLQGAGQGSIATEALHHVDFAFPGLATKGYDCVTADLKPLSQSLGTRIDGILGYEFLSRFVVTINFERRQLTVQMPAGFHPAPQFEASPIEMRGKWPFVKGELVLPGPVTVQDSFLIDSGSSDAVDHPIVKVMQTKTSTETGAGLGTPVEGSIAHATLFRIGAFTVDRPLIACCGASDATSRLIGTEILRHFTVIFDYSASRLYLAPNHAPGDRAAAR